MPIEALQNTVDALRARLAQERRLAHGFRLDRLHLEPDGILTFEAEAASFAQKKIALGIAAAMPEIEGIVDRLHVRPAVRMGDAEIRAHLRRIYSTDPTLAGVSVYERRGETLAPVAEIADPLGRLDYEVVDGIVTLNGSVNGLTVKRYIGVLAWWVPGARDVINGIEDAAAEADSPDRIAEAVRLALEKDPYVNDAQVKIGVRRQVVRLTGLLPSEPQRDMAEKDAWYVFGVDDVINEIALPD